MIALAVLALPVLGAVVALAAGHREERAASVVGVTTTVAAWLGALVLGVQHWGRDATADVVGPYDVPTGGIPIEPISSCAWRMNVGGAFWLI